MTVKVKRPIFSDKRKAPMRLNPITFAFAPLRMINDPFSGIPINQAHNFIHFNWIQKELL